MVNIKIVAQNLLRLSRIELLGIAKVLQADYGIEALPPEDNQALKLQEEAVEQRNAISLRVSALKRQREKPYAPRKIGKPCGFPKNMRRK